MRLLLWIGGALLLAGGAAWWRATANGGEKDELAALGDVRGAPLRSAPSAQGVEGEGGPGGTAASLASTSSAAPAPTEGSPAEDYAELLPPGEAQRYPWIDFALLMEFDFPGLVTGGDSAELPEIPAEVRELDGTLVAIEGFMNPLSFDAQGVSEFTLVADPTFCCFGVTPQLNHFVHVSLPEGERCDFHSMVPIAVFGELSVGPEEEDGILLSLYRLEARHVLTVY